LTSVLSFGRLDPAQGVKRRKQALTTVRDARHHLRAELMNTSESIFRSLFRRDTVIVYEFILAIASMSVYQRSAAFKEKLAAYLTKTPGTSMALCFLTNGVLAKVLRRRGT
jgi:hypothetical protein